LILFWFKCIR